jgi:nicotinate-nucleotide adenylyltransferase
VTGGPAAPVPTALPVSADLPVYADLPVCGRLGVLGGTFDPIHLGHLAIAEEAREALGLERVLFVPAGRPWQKSDRSVSAAADRVA